MVALPPLIKKYLGDLGGACVGHMGDIIIFTSVAAWVASSAAQIIGIALNKNYSHDQKKFMIAQEAADAFTNIALYFGITSSLKWISSKMVSTGKLAPQSVIDFMTRKKVLDCRGRYGFDLTKVAGFGEEIKSSYDSFKNFAEASAAIVGGVISSNLVTPVVRNEVASYRQNKYKREIANNTISTKTTIQQPSVNKNQIYTQRHTFADFSKRALSI